MNECVEAKRRLAEKLAPCTKALAAIGAESAHMSRPSATHHLAILKEAGLVSVLKEGTKNYYYLDANAALWGRLAALFSEISDTVKRADEEGYPYGHCIASEKE